MTKTKTAAILAAGRGTRLRARVGDLPKALVPLQGIPLLLRTIELLKRYGVEHVVVATGYGADLVRAALAQAPLRVTSCHNERFAETQNSVSLWECRSALRGQAFFKLDGDIVFSEKALERLDAAAAGLAVAVDETRMLDEEAMKVTCSGSRVLAFGKQLPLGASSGESIGIERIGADASEVVFAGLGAAVATDDNLYYEDVYGRLIAAGVLEAEAVNVGDLPWTEIDTPEDLDHALQVARLLSPERP